MRVTGKGEHESFCFVDTGKADIGKAGLTRSYTLCQAKEVMFYSVTSNFIPVFLFYNNLT